MPSSERSYVFAVWDEFAAPGVRKWPVLHETQKWIFGFLCKSKNGSGISTKIIGLLDSAGNLLSVGAHASGASVHMCTRGLGDLVQFTRELIVMQLRSKDAVLVKVLTRV